MAVILLLMFLILALIPNLLQYSSGKDPTLEKLLADEEFSIVSPQGEVMEDKIFTLRLKDYEVIKESMGFRKEFCIYFKDEQGNIISIDEDTHALGSPNIVVNDYPCVW